MEIRNPPPRSKREFRSRERVLSALSHMRRDDLSLTQACRQEHVKPATFLRHAGTAVRQEKRGGRYRAKPNDRIPRQLLVPTALGPVALLIRSSKQASEVARYSNAVSEYLRTGKTTQLERFRGKLVGIRGKEVELLTDPRTLSGLAEAGALQFDQLYASFAKVS